jgi:CBS domain-containing protein
MNNGLVKNWMSSPVVTVTLATGLTQARKLLSEKHIRALPVMENDQLIGIVTRRGLLRADFSFLEVEAGRPATSQAEAKISDVVTLNPITIMPDAIIPKAARIMLENKITALPVMAAGKLTGILTTSDLLRFILTESPALKRKFPVSHYMTDEVISIHPDATLLEAHALMGTKRIRSLVVLDGEALAGVITRTDLMSSDPSRLDSRHSQELSLRILTQPVEKVMSRAPITILPTAPVTEAAELMLRHKIHCLPVVAEDKKLVGIITESDLFLMILQKFN